MLLLLLSLSCFVLWCGAVCFELVGTRRRDSGGLEGEACWGIIIQVLALGSMSWSLPGRRGGELPVNIAILRRSEREQVAKEKDLQPEMET